MILSSLKAFWRTQNIYILYLLGIAHQFRMVEYLIFIHFDIYLYSIKFYFIFYNKCLIYLIAFKNIIHLKNSMVIKETM